MTPYFDTVPEDTDLYSVPQIFRKTVSVAPLRPGAKAPLINLPRRLAVWQYITWQTDSAGTIHLHDLLVNGPLVVAFYSSGWNGYAEPYLQKLTRLYTRLRQAGTNLLVLSPDSVDHLQSLVEQQDLPFTIAQDADNFIADQFGVHSASDLVWNRIAGITEDVPFPGLFVVGQNREVLFSYVDKDFTEDFPRREVLERLEQPSATEVLAYYDRSAA
ncbi:redoxin domain-containing protein [Larkinella soli]|uniref:redoxin domain-containing protein n=1 Tax=Larkinella soli TaxID=1770527 RepID=UPI000FFC8C11|nr:redoxin domain-containing protein [Larkinella soli]